ncbi:DNA double-strand break repair nuclease NurA [Natroniella sulfidigena]|uniref:DNA double-strand break repair nuclease NurA n=1 Tax=Natroniella sulfidigena TaxID=723921 RepID=UPI00200BA0FB|nr:DNA double-strand break repair nuclease NurA [Natroniella sulfidigena]MCK8817084.1 DNA double-strand break repair nuclease NurA [Natroniella sulfidigena]
MNEITTGLKSLLQECNQKLKEKYQNQANLAQKELRNLISQKVGKIVTLNEIDQQEIEEWLAEQDVVGVDGSINTLGKNYPHYITLLQALAKSTDKNKEGIVKHEAFSPLIDEDRDKIRKKTYKDNLAQENKDVIVYPQEAAGKIKSSLLAALEILVAKDSILEWNPKLIMMDGSLIRYQMQAEEEWKRLVELALENDVILVGVIEEIGTNDLSKNLADDLPAKMIEMYDRELLFGLLEMGEMIKLEEIDSFKGETLSSVFLRTTRDPGVIGLDILKEQEQELDLIAALVQSLTPAGGRGIPIWLDIVDEEVRITDKMMELLIDNYLEPGLKQKLFHAKSLDRIY